MYRFMLLPAVIVIALCAVACASRQTTQPPQPSQPPQTSQAPQTGNVREEYVKARPPADDRLKEAILKGEALPGMTVEQVMVSCGPPQSFTSQRNQIGGYDTVWNYPRFAVVFGEDNMVKEVK